MKKIQYVGNTDELVLMEKNIILKFMPMSQIELVYFENTSADMFYGKKYRTKNG